MNPFQHICFRAIVVAMACFYLMPVPALIVVTSIPNFLGFDPTRPHATSHSPVTIVLGWFYVIAPVAAGYMAAKKSRHQPLLHGLVVGVLGGLLVVLWVQGESIFFDVVIPASSACLGVIGGWFWRWRKGGGST